jgi:hypothetical protein
MPKIDGRAGSVLQEVSLGVAVVSDRISHLPVYEVFLPRPTSVIRKEDNKL